MSADPVIDGKALSAAFRKDAIASAARGHKVMTAYLESGADAIDTLVNEVERLRTARMHQGASTMSNSVDPAYVMGQHTLHPTPFGPRCSNCGPWESVAWPCLPYQLAEALTLAIAHDRQPYPTAEAYERVCALLSERDAELTHLRVAQADARAEQDTVYDEVRRERERAHAKHGDTSMEAKGWGNLQRLAILIEEVGEVGRAFNDHEHGKLTSAELRRDVRAELIQVAAMAAGWADAVPVGAPSTASRSAPPASWVEQSEAESTRSTAALSDDVRDASLRSGSSVADEPGPKCYWCGDSGDDPGVDIPCRFCDGGVVRSVTDARNRFDNRPGGDTMKIHLSPASIYDPRSPRVSVLIVLDNEQGHIEGGHCSVPTARHLIAQGAEGMDDLALDDLVQREADTPKARGFGPDLTTRG